MASPVCEALQFEYVYHKVCVCVFSLVSFSCVPRLQGYHLRPPSLAQISGLCPGTALQKQKCQPHPRMSTISVSMWSVQF